MTLKRNLIANYLGQGWSAAMGLAFIPLYIRYLGMESYGLIGIFAVMQAWLAMLDMGLTPTLNREMARFNAGVHTAQYILDLLRSLECLCFGLAAVIALSIWAASGYMATGWLQAGSLSFDVVGQALAIMGVVVALRFCEGIYRGSLFGLQQQVWFNGVNALLATLRHGGAVAILVCVSPTVAAFFYWQGVCSLIGVAVLAWRVHRVLPSPPVPAVFSMPVLRDVSQFAGGMMGITLLSILLTQVDKLLLSRMLTLDHFGAYTLAGTVAGTFYLLIVPITQAFYPRMVELVSNVGEGELVELYHLGAQIVTVLTLPVALTFFFHGDKVIFLWSGDTLLARNVGLVLAPLVLGTFLNGMMHLPYQLQLANGWTSFTVKINLVGVAVLIPAILWVVPRYGAVGAAWIWVALNAGYVLVAIQFMHVRLIPPEKWRWYKDDLAGPVAGAALMFVLGDAFAPPEGAGRWAWAAFLAAVSLLALMGAAGGANRIRPRIQATIMALIRRASQPAE